ESVLEIVNDDMPFLLDSVLAELAERGFAIRFVVHPVFSVTRDGEGRVIEFKGTQNASGALRESFIHIHFDRVDDARAAETVAALERVLADVRAAVTDWRAMTARVVAQIAEIEANPPRLPAIETAEAVEFLEWLLADNFTFLGVREYVL
ncbi:MAG: NAD-glutamate dehydrogenase, partial [Alphaproteobacteria bacterium]